MTAANQVTRAVDTVAVRVLTSSIYNVGSGPLFPLNPSAPPPQGGPQPQVSKIPTTLSKQNFLGCPWGRCQAFVPALDYPSMEPPLPPPA